MKHSHVYISLVLVWLVGPVEKICLHWFPSGVVDGTCYVCMYFHLLEIFHVCLPIEFFLNYSVGVMLIHHTLLPIRPVRTKVMVEHWAKVKAMHRPLFSLHIRSM